MAANDSLRLPEGGDLDLLLVGKSGNGKMSAGNAILGRKTFTSLGNGKTHQVGYSEVDGRVIKVVDVLGFCHQGACSHSEDAANIFTEALSKGISQFPLGFNAIVFVLSFTKKFTKEEEKVVKALEEILGDDVMKKYGVCLMTHGDAFNEKTAKVDDVKDEDGDGDIKDDMFLKWCKRQKGSIRHFFEECHYRCVLFDNVSQDTVCQKRQRLDLVNLVDKFEEKHTLYTLDSFVKSQKKKKKEKEIDPHDHTEGECKLPMVLETISRENSLIQEAVLKFKQQKDQDKDPIDHHSGNTTGANGDYNDSNSISTKDFEFNPIKIKRKSNHLLHEIGHHEPEKLVSLKPELERIRRIMAECEIKIKNNNSAAEDSDGHHGDDDGVENEHEHEHEHSEKDEDNHKHEHGEEKHGHANSERNEDDHEHSQDPSHGNDHHHSHNNNNDDDDDDDNGDHDHDDNHHHHHHGDSDEENNDHHNNYTNFDTSSLDEDKLNDVLESTENIKARLVEIRDKEEEYHSWISTSVTSPVRHLINTAFPSVVEGLVEVTDFIVDTLFD